MANIFREIKWFFIDLKNATIKNKELQIKCERQAESITKLEKSRKEIKRQNKELRENLSWLRRMYRNLNIEWSWERKRYYNTCVYIEELFRDGKIDEFVSEYDFNEQEFYIYVMNKMKREGKWNG